MNKIIATTVLAFALAGCTASPSQAPTVSKEEKTLPSLFGPAAGGPVLTPKPGAPLFGPAVSDSCVARHDQTPCTLTNQEAFIEILKMSQTNGLIQCYKPAATWQDLMLPPVKTGECK